nr:MAG TPA: hypothetical protein [Caudoviricetes sp.]
MIHVRRQLLEKKVKPSALLPIACLNMEFEFK